MYLSQKRWYSKPYKISLCIMNENSAYLISYQRLKMKKDRSIGKLELICNSFFLCLLHEIISNYLEHRCNIKCMSY